MIKRLHHNEAVAIGLASYELQAWMSLPPTATVEQQIEALEIDQTWQRDHNQEICPRIDRLIQSISAGKIEHDRR